MRGTAAPAGPSIGKLLSRAIVLWVGSFMFLVGLVFTVLNFQNALTEHHFQDQGLAVDAIVTNKSLERAKRGENSHTRYVVSYRFPTQEGRNVDGSTEVPVEVWERLEAGQKIPVTYLPDTPESSRAQERDDDSWIAAYLFMAIGCVFILVGGGLAFYEGRSVVRTIRLSRRGHPTEGTVVRVGPSSTSINRARQWCIDYQYRDHVGRSQEGQSHLLSPEDASVWHEGDTGIVRFDRERPSLSVWMGKA